jgi:HK97 family phage major capsid protein
MLNPSDEWAMRLTKDDEGKYIIGNPTMDGAFRLWGLTVVPSTVVTVGTFLVGSSSPVASQICFREGLSVELSTEDDDNFEKNLVTLRAELRAALAIYRPNAFVYGSLAKSPS